ncbi:MAG: NADH:ubiquinone oxidoreductase [Haloarculaceae archaeon]
MTREERPKVAFFDFTGCEGDQLQVINLEERLFDLVEVVDVVSFREATSARADDYEIAFVEGGVATAHDERRLTEIREHADAVVALGSCAAFAGINAIRNGQDFDEMKERVYGDDADAITAYRDARPIGDVIEVDYEVPGCPIDPEEFVQTVTAIVAGGEPSIPNHPVCLECKFEENTCAFHRGEVCLGPITRGGCGATCVSEGTKCWGCRGMVDDPSEGAYTEVLVEHGLTPDEVIEEYQLYWGWQREAEGAGEQASGASAVETEGD